MIDTRGVVRAFVSVMPSLAAEVQALDLQWDGDPPPTILMAKVGRFWMEHPDQTTHESWHAVFGVIERAMVEGSQYTKDVVATGLLEAMVAAAERAGAGRDLIDRHAGPRSLDYLHAWDAFCSGER